MKHLRTKLLAAVAMLAIAAIMMTTASYAWFTISTNPEISDIKANVTSNGNLEIQLANGLTAPSESGVGDAGQNQKWGNLVDLKEAFQTTAGAAKITLKPVAATEANNKQSISFQAPTFGLDGRIKTLDSLTQTSVANGTKDNFKDFENGVYTFNDASEAWCFEIDFWLRTNVSGNDISLSAAAYRDSQSGNPAGNAEQGLGSYIEFTDTPVNKDIVTIKVVDTGITYDYTAATPAVTANTGNGTVHSVTIGNLSNKKGTLTLDSNIALAQNVAKLIRVYVYMNGADLTNADFMNSATDLGFTLNLQFAGDVTLNDMKPSQSDYGRATAATITPTPNP